MCPGHHTKRVPLVYPSDIELKIRQTAVPLIQSTSSVQASDELAIRHGVLLWMLGDGGARYQAQCTSLDAW